MQTIRRKQRHWRFWVISIMLICGGTVLLVGPLQKRRLSTANILFFREHGILAQAVDTVLSVRNVTERQKYGIRRHFLRLEYERRYIAEGVEIRQIRKSVSQDRSVVNIFSVAKHFFYYDEPQAGLNNGFPYRSGATDYPVGATFTFTLSYDPNNPAHNSADTLPMPFYIRYGFGIGLMLILLSPLFLNTTNVKIRRRRRL